MDESDLSIHQTANEHIFGIGYCLKDSENLVALRMGPPTPLNRLVDDRLSQTRNGSFGRRENYAMFMDEGNCFRGSHIMSPDGPIDYAPPDSIATTYARQLNDTAAKLRLFARVQRMKDVCPFCGVC